MPIVEREKIEEFQEKYTDKIVNFPGISFYILFNENLLDEEKLQAMIWEKKKELEKLNQAVDQRKKEYAEYFQRQETLKNQSVTKEKWEEIQELLKTLEEEKKSLEKDIRDAAQELDSLKTAHEKLQNLLIKSAAEIDRQKQRLEDFPSWKKIMLSMKIIEMSLKNVKRMKLVSGKTRSLQRTDRKSFWRRK